MAHAGGAPRKFKSPDELDALFREYLDYCNDKNRMPNIAGFCRFCKYDKGFPLHRDTFYEYAKYPEFSDTIKSIDMCLEDEVLNCKAQKDLIKLAYLNNKCGYSTKTDINVTAQQAPVDVEQLRESLKGFLSDMTEDQKKQLLGD